MKQTLLTAALLSFAAVACGPVEPPPATVRPYQPDSPAVQLVPLDSLTIPAPAAEEPGTGEQPVPAMDFDQPPALVEVSAPEPPQPAPQPPMPEGGLISLLLQTAEVEIELEADLEPQRRDELTARLARLKERTAQLLSSR